MAEKVMVPIARTAITSRKTNSAVSSMDIRVKCLSEGLDH
jgi:hypothetical protein